jgi:subtilase family serine protease
LTANPAFAFEKAQMGARAAAQTQLEFDIYLPLEHKAELLKLEEALQTPGSPQYHQWLKPAEFAARFAPSQATVAAITEELAASGLQVTEVHSHALHVTGSVGAVERAFARCSPARASRTAAAPSPRPSRW